jgi:putative DNA primase/helicase
MGGEMRKPYTDKEIEELLIIHGEPDEQEPALPTTYEEWVEIHGEPVEYTEQTISATRQIEIVECEEPNKVTFDENSIVFTDKNDNQKLNYANFVEYFAAYNNCVFCNGLFYTPDGSVSPQTIRRDISLTLKDMQWIGKRDTITTSLFNTLRDDYSVEKLPVNEKIIPLANGDLHLNQGGWVFRLGEKKHAPYRLSVSYTPKVIPTPLFNKWLSDVFDPSDIPILQEIMGYCLVPSTSVQEAFIIVGDGDAGKSGFGTILKKMLGNAYISIQTKQLVEKQFHVAEVENRLVAYDDDLGSEALTETGLFKKLVTADTPIPAERKFTSPYQFDSYCRIVASANFMLSSLYDDSDGFYRRLHPILVKPKDPNRKNINNFYEMIWEQEGEQIFKWALEGLRRVLANDWEIAWSERSLKYLNAAKSNAIHFGDFFNETCEQDSESNITTAELTALYHRWCKENGVKEASARRLANWLADNSEKIGAVRSENISRSGRHLRGYQGVRVRGEWKNITLLG